MTAPGVVVGNLLVCCGDCEHYPCECPCVDDWDLPLLGHCEGGARALQVAS